jgi:competence protein ComGC
MNNLTKIINDIEISLLEDEIKILEKERETYSINKEEIQQKIRDLKKEIYILDIKCLRMYSQKLKRLQELKNTNN